MFEKEQRYTLQRTDEFVDEQVQIALWDLLDLRIQLDVELDSIQCFDFYVVKLRGQETQMVIHRQEQPAWGKAYFLRNVPSLIHMKSIWIVDNGQVSIMCPYLHDLPETFDELKTNRGGIYGV